MKAKVYFVARSENVFYAVSDMAEGKIDVAVQMTENNLVDLVFFKELRKQGGLKSEPHGGIMNERDERIPLPTHLVDFFETQPESFGFAQVKLFVVLGIILTARACPTARTADDDV